MAIGDNLISRGEDKKYCWCLDKNTGVEALQTHPSVYEGIMSTAKGM